MRPVIKPGLRRLWRAPQTLQLGTGPTSGLVLEGVGPTLARVLDLLDGTREPAQIAREAPSVGAAPHAAARLLHLLEAGDALEEPSAPTGTAAERLGPDRASLGLVHRGPGAATAALRRRAERSVTVCGAGRVGAQVAALLAAAGVGDVRVEDPGVARPADVAPGGLRPRDVGRRRGPAGRDLVARWRTAAGPASEPAAGPVTGRGPADLVVLAAPGPLPAPRALTRSLTDARRPHLCAGVDEVHGVVGPLVVPGRSACLRCLDLHRRDRDPAWPLLLAQLSTATGTEPCDVGLATVVAGVAALQAVAFLDGGLPASAGGTLELTLPDWRLRRRSWPPHPDCGCLDDTARIPLRVG